MPHYDLLSTSIYAEVGKHHFEELSQKMGAAAHFGELRKQHVLHFGQALGLPEALSARIIEQMKKTIVPAAVNKLLQSPPMMVKLAKCKC